MDIDIESIKEHFNSDKAFFVALVPKEPQVDEGLETAHFYCDPGTATSEQVMDLVEALETLWREMGGTGNCSIRVTGDLPPSRNIEELNL